MLAREDAARMETLPRLIREEARHPAGATGWVKAASWAVKSNIPPAGPNSAAMRTDARYTSDCPRVIHGTPCWPYSTHRGQPGPQEPQGLPPVYRRRDRCLRDDLEQRKVSEMAEKARHVLGESGSLPQGWHHPRDQHHAATRARLSQGTAGKGKFRPHDCRQTSARQGVAALPQDRYQLHASRAEVRGSAAHNLRTFGSEGHP